MLVSGHATAPFTAEPGPGPRIGGRGRRTFMSDTSFILITVGFFAVSVAYAYFCEKVR